MISLLCDWPNDNLPVSQLQALRADCLTYEKEVTCLKNGGNYSVCSAEKEIASCRGKIFWREKKIAAIKASVKRQTK